MRIASFGFLHVGIPLYAFFQRGSGELKPLQRGGVQVIR
jgi:hypothetical protein